MTYRYTYKITCTAGKFKDCFYYGSHKTDNLDDGYKGSGKKLLDYYKKYPNDFKKEIIGFYDNDEDMFNAEYELIHPVLNTKRCLNIKEGGSGGSYKGINKGIKHTEEWNKKTSDTNWLNNLDNPKYNEVYKKWRQTMKEMERNFVRSEESNKKISDKLKGRIITEEWRNKISKTMKERGTTKDRCWMSNGIDRVFPKKENADYYLNLGYHFGWK